MRNSESFLLDNTNTSESSKKIKSQLYENLCTHWWRTGEYNVLRLLIADSDPHSLVLIKTLLLDKLPNQTNKSNFLFSCILSLNSGGDTQEQTSFYSQVANLKLLSFLSKVISCKGVAQPPATLILDGVKLIVSFFINI